MEKSVKNNRPKVVIKSSLLLVIFFSILVSVNYIQLPLGNDFIYQNSTFCFYFILFLVVIMLFFNELLSEILVFDKTKLKILYIIALLTFLAMVFSAIVLNILRIDSLNQVELDNAEDNSMLLKLTSIFLGPVVEEIVFRYSIFSLFSSKKLLASIVSVAAFSFMHVWDYILIEGIVEQFVAMLPYVCFGIGSCVLYVKTQNICFPILLHAIINLITVVL